MKDWDGNEQACALCDEPFEEGDEMVPYNTWADMSVIPMLHRECRFYVKRMAEVQLWSRLAKE